MSVTITSQDGKITKSFPNADSRDNFLRIFYLEKLDDHISSTYNNFAIRESIGEQYFDVSRLSRSLTLVDVNTILGIVGLSSLWVIN